LDRNLFLANKPVARKGLVAFLESVRDLDIGDGVSGSAIGISAIDRYNLEHAISVSGEWAASGDGAINSRTPWFGGTFYRKQPDMVYVKTPEFFLSANPVISVSGIGERSSGVFPYKNSLLASSRGVEVRAR